MTRNDVLTTLKRGPLTVRELQRQLGKGSRGHESLWVLDYFVSITGLSRDLRGALFTLLWRGEIEIVPSSRRTLELRIAHAEQRTHTMARREQLRGEAHGHGRAGDPRVAQQRIASGDRAPVRDRALAGVTDRKRQDVAASSVDQRTMAIARVLTGIRKALGLAPDTRADVLAAFAATDGDVEQLRSALGEFLKNAATSTGTVDG